MMQCRSALAPGGSEDERVHSSRGGDFPVGKDVGVGRSLGDGAVSEDLAGGFEVDVGF